MNIIFFIAVLFFNLQLVLSDSDDDHGHDHDHDHDHDHGGTETNSKFAGVNGYGIQSSDWYLDSIMSKIGASDGEVNSSQIHTLLDQMNFVECKENSTSMCNLCFNEVNLTTWYNVTDDYKFKESEFEKIIQILVFALTKQYASRETCETETISMLKLYTPSKMFLTYQSSDYKLGMKKANESIEMMLKDINRIIGMKLTTKACYDEVDVLQAINKTDNSIDEHDFPWLMNYITHSTIEERCIDLNKIHRKGINGLDVMTADFYVEKVMKEIDAKNSVVRKAQIKELLEKLNFKHCHEEEPHYCNLCLNASDVMTWYNPKNDEFTEEQFHDLLHGIIYLIVSHKETKKINCENERNQILKANTSTIYDKLKTGRWKVGVASAVSSITQILNDVKFVMGNDLKTSPCHNVDDVLFGTNIYDNKIDEQSFGWIIAYLTHEIIDGRCILPRQEIFIEDILRRYGNTTHLTQDEFNSFVKSLELGQKSSSSSHSESEHDHHDHHDHRRRRSVNVEVLNNELKKCYDADSLLRTFNIQPGQLIDASKLMELQSALVQQIDQKTCADPSKPEKKSDDGKGYDGWEPWIATIVAVLILTIGSCAGYLATPLQNKPWFPYLMIFMIALAVSVLTGDAILHLLPEALGVGHSHGGGEEHSDHDEEEENVFAKDSYIWKCLLFLFGGYLFFTFEMIMRVFGFGEHSHGSVMMNQNGDAYPQNAHLSTFDQCKNTEISKKAIPMKDFKPVAWMILLGDALHNFLDGLAIGVAFSANWPSGFYGGISTTIAIFCHEVPHELGDFAVLLSAGLSVNQALVMNYISALTAFLGGFVGCGIGTTTNATEWVFAIAGGLFMYMALTNMLPEAFNNSAIKKHKWLSIVILQFGMLLGYGIMFVLGAYEGDIQGSIS